MTSGLTLEVLATDINARLNKGDDYILAAAIHLNEARERVDAGEAGAVTFAEWCRENIRTRAGLPRPMSEIKRLLGYARSPDPSAAIEKRRKQVREAVARHSTKDKSGLANPNAVADIDDDADEPGSPADWHGRKRLLARAVAGLDNEQKVFLISTVMSLKDARALVDAYDIESEGSSTMTLTEDSDVQGNA
jgi:hypothetical protein